MNTSGHRLDNENAASPRRGSHFSAHTVEDETLFSPKTGDTAVFMQAAASSRASLSQQATRAQQPRESQANDAPAAQPVRRSIDVPQIDQLTRPMTPQAQTPSPAPAADPFATRVVDLSAQDEPTYQAYEDEPMAPAYDPFEYHPSVSEASYSSYAAPAPAYQPYAAAVDQGYQAYDEAPVYEDAGNSYYEPEGDAAPRFSEFSPIKKTLFVATVVLLLACIVAEALAIFAQPAASESSVSQAEDANTEYLKNGELSNDPNTLEDES